MAKRLPLACDLAIAQVRDYAIFMADASGRAASWNEGVMRVLGWPEEEWIGQAAHSIFLPEEQQEATRELETAVREGQANDDRWLMRRDGKRFFANGVTTAIFDNGQHIGFLKVLRDETRKHEHEEQLRRSDERKNVFLATLAHELRNPLATVRNGIQIMQQPLSDQTMARQALAMMERQMGYLTHLIDDLLDVSRITHGRLELRQAPVHLTTIIEGAVEIARSAIDAEGHSLTVELPTASVTMVGDVTRLVQVFANLLVNAAKYTARGGRIRLSARQAGDRVMVSVTDTGQGLSADALADVFEMYWQYDKSDAARGLGIGLALARMLVEMHGGTIRATSPGVGKGSTFDVELPLMAKGSSGFL